MSKANASHPRPPCYLIERAHHSQPNRWHVVGSFDAGTPWRDGRPVDKDTMTEEKILYRQTWPHFMVRIRCPDGTFIR